MNFQVYPLKMNAVAVYISSSMFKDSQNIIDKINNMYGECFEGIFDTTIKNTVLVLYVEMETIENKNRYLEIYKKDNYKAFNILKLNTNNIKGFLRIELYDKHIEIYDVCTGRKHRRTGVMHALFENVLEDAPPQFKTFWLGVTFDNPNRDIAINFYLNNRFSFDNITFQTPSLIKLKFPVLSFIHKRGQANEKSNVNIYTSLSSLECNFVFNLNWKDAILIQNNVYDKNTEACGVMTLSNKGKEVFLSPNLQSVVYGNAKTFTINPPDYYVNWHSHPAICYTTHNCYIGWPSSLDMKYLYYKYSFGILLHFTFTGEGLYSLRLSKEAMKFVYIIALNRDWLNSVAELIYYRFHYIEQYRKNNLFSDSKEKEKNIAQFLEKANNFTLKEYIIDEKNEKKQKFLSFIHTINYSKVNNDVIEAVKYFEQFAPANFPLFEVKFYTSDYILNNKNSVERIPISNIRSPLQSYCPN